MKNFLKINRALVAKKKLFFIFALLSVSLMSWATEYCCEEMTATDDVTKAYISCTNPSENTYVIALYSNAASYSGIIGDNFHCKINGSLDPNCHMTDDAACVKNWDSSNKIYTFTITSTTAPVMTSPIYLNISGEKTFTTIQGASFDWPSSCSCSFPGDDPDPTEVYNTNFALQSNGATAAAKSGNEAGNANDNNKGTRWWSATSTEQVPMTDAEEDDQWWQVDLGQRRIFNTIHILWEGAWGKSFDIQISNDASDWTTVKEIRDQNLSGQTFPYLQILTLDANQTARYVRFQGIKRGTDYAYSFWEFRVLLPTASVLTNITLSAANDEALIGSSGVALTTVLTDQNDVEMEGSVSYEITPAGAGHMSGCNYIPDQMVNASIRAYSGSVYSSAVTILGVPSANLALSTNIDTDNKIIAQSDYSPSGTSAFYAVDGNNGSEYQGSSTNGTDGDEAARTYDCWFTVDLGANFDIDMVTINFEGACAELYHLDFSADNSAWETGYNYVGSAGINGRKDILTSSLSHNTNVRYVKFVSTRAATQWGMKIFEFQVFGSESSSATKSVSASVNDVLMGTATVKQLGDDVTEVETGSEVTFSAVANDGYIFVNWSNGETEATFNATVDANMNLTANFRALRTIYCNTEMTASGHTIYVTLKKSGENEYKLIVNSTEELSNFGGTVMYKPDNTVVKDLRNQGVLSNGNHTLTGTMISDRDIYFGTPLYVVIAGGVGEVTYSVDQGVANTPEYAVPCADAVTTGITLSQTSANLLMGSTLTLTPSFAPVYTTDRALTWVTSNSSVATVDDGVVTPVATGSVTITAKLTSDNSIYATCDVEVVDALSAATWYGYSTLNPQEGFTAYTYSITRNANQTLTFTMKTDKNVVGYVSGIEGDVTGSFSGYTAETHTGSFTTDDTYTDNTLLNLQLTFASANYGATPLNIAYRVGSSNDALGQAIAIDESADNTAILTTYDAQSVVGVVKRSFTAGNLYTLVLPFNVDAAQTAEKLPGQLTKLNNSYLKENGDLRLNFVNESAIEAGVPYLYVPSANVTNPAFINVTASKDLDPTTPVDGLAEYHGIFAPTTGTALKTISDAYVLGSDQYLYAAQNLLDAQEMPALRGYFVLNFSSAAQGAPKKRAKVIFNNSETETPTAVETVQSDNAQCVKVIENGMLYIIREGKTYNAQGQLIK